MSQRHAFQNWGSAFALVLLSSIALLHAFQFRFVSIDDAYITYRYAENIARGLGYVFNPGERVEGTSTFLFTLLLAIAGYLRLNVELAARCVGVGSFVVLVCQVYNYVRKTIKGRSGFWLAPASALMVASSTSLAFHAALGMELLLYISLLTAGIFGYLRNANDASQSRHWMLWLALAAATRTEALFVAIALAGCVAITRAIAPIRTGCDKVAELFSALKAMARPFGELA